MADELRHVNLDARQIRVLAHPLRARLLSQLRLDGAATATKLAGKLGTNTGATSYHLRQLADVGLVAEDEGAGRGRERWWRAAHDVTRWDRDAYAGDADATAAADWFTGHLARVIAKRVEDWHHAAPNETAEWRQAADLSDYILTLNAPQLTALTKELDGVIERWRSETRATPAEGARQILIYLYSLPRPKEES
jgi:predicted ArsR family transcriptional regulator